MRTTTTLFFLALTLFGSAQWSTDPANPLVICDATGQQRDPRAIEDGNGGWYVFWRDARNGSSNTQTSGLYGQHVDADGYAQWTTNGEMILEHPGQTIQDLQLTKLANGKLLILYRHNASGGDTIRAVLLETDASHTWPDPVVVAQRDSPLMSFEEFAVHPSGGGALIAYHAIVIGGSATNKVDKINADGTLVHGINGFDVNNTAYGPMGMVTDENEGAIVHWRNGNGGGTHMGVLRLDSNAALVWPAIVDPVAGTPGLYWAYNAIADGEGGIAIAYVEGGGNGIKFARLDSTGASAITPSTKPAGAFSSGQDLPELVLHDGHFFVCWQDNRPPANNQDLYVQKLDMNGDPVWDPAGELAVQINTYIPHARIIPTDSGGVIVAQLASLAGFIAQRVRNDGTTAWATLPALCDDGHVPFYGEFAFHKDGLGGGAAFWYNQDNSDLYAAHIDFFGNVGDHTGVADGPTETLIQLFPNPSFGTFELQIPEQLVGSSVTILDAVGRVVHSTNAQKMLTRIDIEDRAPGMYLLELVSTKERIITRLLKE